MEQEDKEQVLAPTQEYQILQHTYLSLVNKEQAVSIHQIPLPFIAKHIFNVDINPQTISPQCQNTLNKLHKQVPSSLQRQEQEQQIMQQEETFDIGGKEESQQVVKVGLKKGMKSLANVSSYLMTNFLGKKK